VPGKPAFAAPQLTMTPDSGARGTVVTVMGANFASYIGDVVYIFFGGVEINDSPQSVPQDGTIEVTFTVPYDAAPGILYTTVTDANGVQLAKSNPFTLMGVDIMIDPDVGSVGTNVTIHGQGLYSSDSLTFYYYNNDTRVKIGNDVSSPIGECVYSFTIPESSSGSHKVIVQEAHGGNETGVYFIVVPDIVLESTLASIGDELVVSGTGFGSRSNVSIYLNSVEVAIKRADEFGSFNAVFTVPKWTSGIGDLEVRDESWNVVRTQITVNASISLSKTSGHVGEEFTINGIGFPGNVQVNIQFDTIPIAEGVTLENGAFLLNLTVPAGIHGNYEITASDGTNLVAAPFSVESVAPPLPKLIMLEDPGNVKPGARFDWEDVTDPSGVTYVFQVANDADFSSVIFEKTGIALSEYVITKQDKLRSSGIETSYYWRVKAVDGALNESQWSTAQAFNYVYGWPKWLQYVILGIVWILTGFVCFRLGRSNIFR